MIIFLIIKILSTIKSIIMEIIRTLKELTEIVHISSGISVKPV